MSIVRTKRVLLVAASLFSLSACSMFQAEYPDKQIGQDKTLIGEPQQNSGLFGGWFDSDQKKDNSANAIGINAYLWRASLETLSFMPLTSADPFGGVIITDWYAPPETPNERFKMAVYITDRELHADGIKVSVFRQVKGDNGWADAATAPKTAADLENAILTRARELRAQNAAVKKS